MPKSVAEAVNKVMADVKHVEKTGVNDFHRYKFAKVEDLLAQVQPAMVKAGLIVVQTEAHSELVAEGQAWAVTYSFGLQHASGEAWDGQVLQTGMATARNSKGGLDDKALNKCHTAARKYFLLALLQVPTGDLPDVDNEEDKAAGEPVAPPSAYRAKQQGLGPRAVVLKHEIDALADLDACTKWAVKNADEIKTMPTNWRKMLREDLETRHGEIRDELRQAEPRQDARGNSSTPFDEDDRVPY